MQTFLDDLAKKILDQGIDPEQTTFILPSKRAGNFLLKALSRQLGKTIFAPEILSIESFIETVSGLSYASNTQLLFDLYASYRDIPGSDKESFYHFSKWGQTLLQDFNEIDRYLVDADHLFSYLSDIKEIDRWNLKSEPTEVIQQYLKFWEGLQPLYHQYRRKLQQSGRAYQGMAYREAVARMEGYLQQRADRNFIFAGFNALNKAEETLIQHFLEHGKASIYWDAHPHFVNDPQHEAGYFIRQHFKHWDVLKNHPLEYWTGEGSDSLPDIEVIGTPRNTSQVKLVGTLLKELGEKEGARLERTAVILGDESLLNPMMHAMPDSLPSINITMGFPLRNSPAYGFFSRIFDLYENKGPTGWYHDHVTALLSHPYSGLLLDTDVRDLSRELIEGMAKMNWLQVGREDLLNLPGEPSQPLSKLFFPHPPNPEEFLLGIQEVIAMLRDRMQAREDALGLEYLYHFNKLFNELRSYSGEYPELNDLRTLHSVFRNLLEGETVDFRGEPLEGLQLMGMLESRILDFETIILTSVNEGILPSGKSQNSLIPFEIKRQFHLPTYKEKDAVYAYHFYRLLMRAKKVYLLYNTVPDTLEGGERSRLISQLMSDPWLGKKVRSRNLAPDIKPEPQQPASISKDDGFIMRIREMAAKGFSPTSLSNYIRDPHVFYMKNVLRIQEAAEVDTELAANVFGTIVHDSLEDLYLPYLNQVLQPKQIRDMIPGAEGVVRKHFKKQYPGANLEQGKNLIAVNVVINYIRRFLNQEVAQAEKEEVRLLGLEKEFHVPIDVPGIDFPIYLKGKVDRIEEVNGRLRIVDYKTGKAASTNTEIYDWEALIADKKYDKAFQLLMYAYMYTKAEGRLPSRASIISFKNLGAGHIQFATKPSSNSRSKDPEITQAVLEHFEHRLQILISEICNQNVPILEKVE